MTRDAVDDGAANIERVHVLMYSATGLGGVARTVNTLAGQLARSHEVHLHSLFRGSDQPQYPIDPRVQVSWLIDNRQTGGRGGRPRRDPHARRKWRRWDNEPSDLEPAAPGVSAYTDFVLRSALPKLAPGLLITTRPMLHLAAARWAPASVLRIAQDHLNFEQRMRNRGITSILDEAVPTVDAFVTLTEADQVDYQKRYPGTLVRRIANPSPFHRQEQASPDAKVVVSAGRLVHRKGFDRLIDAWVPLAAAFPDWQLHIYGKGERRADLEAQIAALGVGDSVRLMGYTPDFDRVLASAGIYAMPSRGEGFPMVLLEAMSHGLPLVSFDCPRGPAEIIDDGVTGRLVKDDDIEGYTRALGEVMSAADRRRSMGAASYAKAETYEVETISAQWEQLLEETLDRRVRNRARP